MLQKILTYSFYLLFTLTPLLWASWNYELFEFNKMMFVYALTLVIIACWLLKTINDKRLTIRTTPLDIPLLLFLLANVLSTIFSIDRHVSIFGYYSRLNGGLLSLFAYIILYYALVSNFSKIQALNFLKAAVLGGVPVALWAIPEHFGISPSCIILTGQFNASCWIQDVQSRVFATLGQPNWLAAYLSMLIFPTLYFALTAIKRSQKVISYLSLVISYIAFTFTYSRGATLGFLAGLLVFLGVILWQTLRFHPWGGKLGGILLAFLLINLFFGSALTDLKLLNKFAPPSRPLLTTSITKPSSTQMENGGTESGQIRLIVWQGAWEIFKAHPLFGSGVETFAQSYYQYRPKSHNLVSEWDFLYNKAHNEFLNYLATTGLVGFASYFIIIITFITFMLRRAGKKELLIFSLLASYISYLVQNFFLFSVVNTALLFYLFPAFAFIFTDSTKPIQIPPKLYAIRYTLYALTSHPKISKGIIILTTSTLLFFLARFYLADIYFAKGTKLSENSPGKAYNTLYQAASLNPLEPFYKSELAYQAASVAVSLETKEATLSSQLKKQAEEQTSYLLKDYPKNVSYFRTAIRTYYLLSTMDQSYLQKTLNTLDQALRLSPTDAKLLYNKGVLLGQQDKKEEAIQALEEALKLKSNYKEARETLEKLKEP